MKTFIALFGKDLVKYGSYALIGFMFIIFVALLGAPPEEEAPLPTTGNVTCQPTGKVITVKELDQKLKGKGVLEGKGDVFISSGQKYGVDPVLVAAIAILETGHGTSNAVKTLHNPGGIMGKNGLRNFPNLDAGIDYMTSNLSRLYIKQGLVTPDMIGPKYAGVGVANDPNNLNVNWIPNVTKFVEYLGGLSYECSVEEIKNIGSISASGFLRPLDKKHPITSYFGPRWGKMHKGLDYGCQLNQTPIVAAKSGTVEVSKFGFPGSGFGGYGNVVLINHGGGVKTLYAHLSSRSVQAGQTVSQGQQVGICGSTGRSTGPRLHFEIRTTSGNVNPLKYLDK